jgi:hypothetical protein
MQYVGVEFRTSPGRVYDYQWDGLFLLKQGDRVMVPRSNWNPMPSFGDVVFLHLSRASVKYKGDLATIIGVVGEDEV